jgi:hypothetical protein
MRKLIVCTIMSLDGYFEGPGGNVMVLPLNGAFDAYCAERLRAADTLLLGRTTYDGFKGFWPSVAEDPSFTLTQREISRFDNEIDKVVVSDTLTPGETAPWHNTRIVGRADAHPQIAALARSISPSRAEGTFRAPGGRHDRVDACARASRAWSGWPGRGPCRPPPSIQHTCN